MSSEQSTSNFIDLISYKRAKHSQGARRGGVIKSKQVNCTGKEMIQVSADGSDQPSIVTRTENGVVVAVEFCCTCGSTASIELDYDQT